MINLGFTLCGSFCTFSKAIDLMKKLSDEYNIHPIMSENAFYTSTRFGKAEEINAKIEKICEKKIIHSISTAEPLGPKNIVDAMVVAPCTGNTLGKISLGITDTAATMAVKSCLRIGIPVVLCIATNDGLAASFANIGKIMNTKNIFIVPLEQDDPILKPNSLVSDFSKLPETLKLALDKIQIQPLI
ncbi:MAG: dipicolinate synthase subunit B [Clostridia bacterium]